MTSRARVPALALAAILAASALAPLAAAHGGGGLRTLLFTVHDGRRDGATVSWFQVDNRTNANPLVTVTPGERVILHVTNAGNRSHNLRVAPPVTTATPLLDPGNETSVTMKVPDDATGSIPYYDQAHREEGAEGRFRVAGTERTRDDGLGLTDPLALAGAAGLALVAAGWWSGRRD